VRPTIALPSSIRQGPALSANAGRNLLAPSAQVDRWGSARDELWRLLDPLIEPSSRVAIVGVGNGHDLPLRRVAARAAQLTLADIDRQAARRARRRLPPALRLRVRVVQHDVTTGAADRLIDAVVHEQVPDPVLMSEAPLPGAPYGLLIGDLLYSQLLYPALLDLGVPEQRQRSILERFGPTVIRGVVARLHASAPHGRVVHIHDPLGWWPGHPQPVALSEILDTARHDIDQALALVVRGRGPRDADPRAALNAFAIPIRATMLWRWPFADETDYLVCATVAGTALRP
jgi:hypothetical protein